MNNFKKIATPIPDLYLIEYNKYGDERGYFSETFHHQSFAELGLPTKFVQDNESFSVQNTLRGLHFQVTKPQGKLVRCLQGEVYDVAVDLRPDSPTYGAWHGVHLKGEDNLLFYVPEGFAHGFLVISPTALFSYKCTNLYDPSDEDSLSYNDPALDIKWPIDDLSKLIISDKDRNTKKFSELLK